MDKTTKEIIERELAFIEGRALRASGIKHDLKEMSLIDFEESIKAFAAAKHIFITITGGNSENAYLLYREILAKNPEILVPRFVDRPRPAISRMVCPWCNEANIGIKDVEENHLGYKTRIFCRTGWLSPNVEDTCGWEVLSKQTTGEIIRDAELEERARIEEAVAKQLPKCPKCGSPLQTKQLEPNPKGFRLRHYCTKGWNSPDPEDWCGYESLSTEKMGDLQKRVVESMRKAKLGKSIIDISEEV
jgi:hypothetical protein